MRFRTKRFRTSFIIVFLALFILVDLPILAPVVDGAYRVDTQSGSAVAVTETVQYHPDPRFNFTGLCNIANNSSVTYYSNYNMTLKPFLNNNTDIGGIMLTPFFTPLIYNATPTNRDITMVGFVHMLPEVIMDGVSEFWIRIPVMQVPSDSVIRFRVGRVLDPIAFNVTIPSFGAVNPVSSTVIKVYDVTYDSSDPTTLSSDATHIPNVWTDFMRTQNTSYGTGENLTYFNFTYIRACAPLFPNEWYMFVFDIQYSIQGPQVRLAICQDDLGADIIHKSWIWMNDSFYYIPADLDFSMILTYGMSNGISGIGTRTSYQIPGHETTTMLHLNSSIPFNHAINKQYLQVIIPFLINSSLMGPLGDPMRIVVTLWSTMLDTTMIARHVDTTIYNASQNFYLLEWDINAYSGQYIDHIRVDFSITDNTTDPDGPALKLWGTAKSSFNWTYPSGYTDIYQEESHIYHPVEREAFVPFGYIGLSTSKWNIITQPIVVIPANTPRTPEAIKDAIHQFDFYLYFGYNAPTNLSDAVHVFGQALGFILGVAIDTFISLAKAYLEVGWWILTLPLRLLWDALVGNPDAPFHFLLGIGQFIWKIITFLIDAFQFVSYWIVRSLYSFSLIIVYVVNVFGVISINSALLGFAKTGSSRDFIRVFKSGWKFVFGIISLLLALLIMAISIVGAVLPL